MAKITNKQRDQIIKLLEQHAALMEAKRHLSETKWSGALVVMIPDGHDSVDILLDREVMRNTWDAQFNRVMDQLRDLGIKMS